MKRYEKYEFCKDVGCHLLEDNKCLVKDIDMDHKDFGCPFSAKHFHKWLQHNLFVIEAPENEYEASNL